MRLTLRTLLAYLDDTMDPAEIKEFGKRVAESDTAQELIARIRQITRRRRLTAPPTTGPGALDPNTVAEYLDNELSSDHVAELEKTCLESDVHLAELAATHQILTLVLGQPALVPPTARERMYALVHGREAIPFRKASTRSADGLANTEDFETAPPGGLGFGKSPAWVRWALPIAGLVVLIGVAIALLPYIPNPRERNRPVAANNKKEKEKEQTDKDNRVVQVDLTDKERVKMPSSVPYTEPDIIPDKGTNPDKGNNPVDPPIQTAKPAGPPSTERVSVGFYDSLPGTPSILVQKRSDGWKRLAPSNPVVTQEPLISLPGFRSMVRLDSGVRLVLSGNTPEFSQHELMDFLLDSAVILHKNADFDADLTLLRGRLYVSNSKAGARVRLRFSGEVWDLTLTEPNTEIGLDLLRQSTRDSNWRAGEEPRTEMYLCVLQGKASLKLDTYFYNNLEAPPGSAVFIWDNEGGRPAGPQRIDKVPPIWSQASPISGMKAQLRVLQEQMQQQPPAKSKEMQPYLDYFNGRIKAGEAMQAAVETLSKSMVDKTSINLALKENSEPSKELGLRLLCIYSMGALDEIGKLLDILSSESETAAPDRDGAIFTLRRWISRGAEQGKLLFHDDGKKKTGLLLAGNRYTPKEADIILTLLHDFNSHDSRRKETFQYLVIYLANDKLAIRELARWHLLRLAQGGPKIPAFDAAWPAEKREGAVAEWKKLLEEDKLPPRQPEPPPMPPKK